MLLRRHKDRLVQEKAKEKEPALKGNKDKNKDKKADKND